MACYSSVSTLFDSRRFCALLLFAAGIAATGCRTANQYIERGNHLFDSGKYGDATLNYRNAVNKNPRSTEAYYRLGLALDKQGELGEAYQSFVHALSLDPQDNRVRVQLADVSLALYARTPDRPAVLYKQAETMAAQLLAPGGNQAEGLRLKGALALADNRPSNAIDTLRQAVNLAPQNPDAAALLAEALMRDQQRAEAEKVALQITKSHPDFGQAYEILYTLAVVQQNWGQAEDILKQWVANTPKDDVPMLRLAAFYYARSRPQDGEKALQMLLDHRAQFPQADLLAGDFHTRVREFNKALANYRDGQKSDAADKKIFDERIASTLQALGRHDEALQAADDILARDPQDQFARVLKVQALQEKGGEQNITAAAALAGTLATQSPGDDRVQLLAGKAAMMSGNLDEAAAHLQRAAIIDPRSLQVQLTLARLEVIRKNYPAVLEHANAALGIVPNDTNAHLMRVIGLTGTRAFDAAKTEAEQLQRENPNSSEVKMQLAAIALGQGRYKEAESGFRALYHEPSANLDALEGLVDTYEAEHMPDRALDLMQDELRKTPDSAAKQTLLVTVAETAGKNDVALGVLQKMAAQTPNSVDVQLQIGTLQQKSGRLPEALAAFEKARQLAPNRPGMDVLVANLQGQMGRKSDAIANYRKALQKTPGDLGALNNLAFLLADTGGDTNDALRLIETALQKAPNIAQFRDTLAWIQIKRHNTTEAMAILRTLTDKYPDDAGFHYHYAVALAQTGDRAKAKREAETALAGKPSPEQAGALHTLLAQNQ